MPDQQDLLEVPLGTTTSFTKTVSEADIYLYAGVSGDFSPNHLDEEFMKGGRYGHRIAHGTLMMAFMSAASSRLTFGRTASVGYDRVRFTAPVFIGDTITTEYRVREYDRQKKRVYADLTCRNQRGEVVAVAVHIRAHVG